MMMEMSRSIAHPASYNGSSSSTSFDGQLDASANGERNEDVHSHIVELSKILDREIRSNTWTSPSSQAKRPKIIFRVPREKQHGADRTSYQPTFLSIGPYHRATNNDATEEMRRNEQGKLCCVGSAIPDGHDGGGGRSVQEYLEAVESMEAEARSCYEGDVEMDRDAFCRMLLLDAFQLIQLLEVFGFAKETEAAGGAAAGATADESACQGCSIRTLAMSMIVHDLIMLENQIPFFVVEKIHELLYGNGNAVAAATTMTMQRPVRELAWITIQAILGGVPSAPNIDHPHLEFQHLVDVCHLYLKPTCLNNVSTEEKLDTTDTYGRFRRATEYYEAGVKFRTWCAAPEAEAGSSSQEQRRRRPVLDVAFTDSDGVLSLALQVIDEKTSYILRNVLAYEQKYYRKATSGDGSYVTAYVVFMSQLLVTADDVALLSRRRVLEHLLGDDAEVCAMFRSLAAGLAFDPGSDHYLKPVGLALQAHCRCRRYRWRAWIVRHRFGNPWLVAAWLFGASAVLCTIVQTVFAVLSYVEQARHVV